MYAVHYIQGDPGGKISILGGDSIGNCEKEIHIRVWCLVRDGYPDGDLKLQTEFHSIFFCVDG